MISLQADESLEENGGTTGEDYYTTNEVKLANKPLILTVRNPNSSKKATSATDSKEINPESVTTIFFFFFLKILKTIILLLDKTVATSFEKKKCQFKGFFKTKLSF